MQKLELQRHSEAYFGDERDYWWNRDFLNLMAARWKLCNVKKMLDVGCGVGHWGRLLAPYLKDDSRVTGIDLEPDWAKKAATHALKQKGACSFEYVVGDARNIPFEDESFDFVTCQTVLIHIQNPLSVLQEFYRVVKPGGIIAVAEPANIVSSLVQDSLSHCYKTSKILEAVEMQVVCERGKIASGEGNNSLGPLVPGLFNKIGLENIQTYLSDKATPLIPPYKDDESLTILNSIRSNERNDFWIWNREETKHYFLAGGGDAKQFDNMWLSRLEGAKLLLADVEKGLFHTGGGSMMYLVSGRKG